MRRDAGPGGGGRLWPNALVVEDQFLIALELEEILLECGFGQVHLAGTVADARKAIEGGGIALAVLDYNLGDESTEALAGHLATSGIPFLLVTGYDPAAISCSDLADAPVVRKPYAEGAIREAIKALQASAAMPDDQ